MSVDLCSVAIASGSSTRVVPEERGQLEHSLAPKRHGANELAEVLLGGPMRGAVRRP
jgi:hypothetical protein